MNVSYRMSDEERDAEWDRGAPFKPKQPALPAMEEEECEVCGQARSRHQKQIDICPFTGKETEILRCPKQTT